MSVRLLGTLEVRLDDRVVEHWHGRVGRTALAYVLLQQRRVPPEELAGALWPDVAAATARNRLHVALHRLRTDLAAVDARPVLVHEQGYTVEPLLRLDLDTDRFERDAEQGDLAVHIADLPAALAGYLRAVDCYGGDLLAGERDDDWALLAREHYRVRLLDVLGKAAHLAFDLDRPALAVDLGQRLLALDFCREDLYRLLMRAYARLGQPQLALRQYQTCVRQLRLEFGLDPASETVELYDQVRCMVPV
jgi:DNA-binding SARP family transcriptional activator